MKQDFKQFLSSTEKDASDEERASAAATIKLWAETLSTL